MKSRMIVVLALLGLWGGAVLARLWQLQVRDHDLYQRKAERQHERRVELQPPRGTIFDTRGRQLAISVDADTVWADPSQVSDSDAAATALARVLGLDRRKLADSLAEDREFVWVARQLDQPVAAAVQRLGLAGVGFLKESKRYYPMRELAGPVLGFAGVDNQGLEGLEGAYNDVIAGQGVERKVVRDARRGTVLLPDISFKEAEPGQDLHLTIDAWVQHLLEQELAAALERTRAANVMGVLVDPNSGAILAMASLPTFDPNHFSDSSPSRWRNRVVTDAFEPGSTFKVVTAAAALERNLVDPSDVFDCEMGSIVIDGVRIHDHKAFGMLTFREIIAKSSNVGAIKTGLAVGREGLFQQIVDFGFGRPTGVDLPGENPGILRSVEQWPKRATAYISFGQNLSVTMLQMSSAFAAIANGGTLYRPYVVAGVGRNGEIEPLHPQPEVLGRPISAATARTLERLLESVVSDGTAKKADIPGYLVAGKTGTAQKAAATGGYAAGKYLASFVGFAPARRPEVVAMFVIDEPDPRVGYHGGDIAAPLFASVVGPTLLYLGVLPDQQPQEHWPGELTAEAEQSPERDPSPVDPNDPWIDSEKVADNQEGLAASVVPDLVGLTARQAVVRSARLGLRVSLHGQGVVNGQVPEPGSAIESAAGRLELWLASGGER